jgi:D-inositol-3-phosphate glycosyltransferase
MRKTIAMISEHASPLADLGGVDSGGQNVYIAHVAQNLARLGYQVDVFTRRDNKDLPEIYNWMDGLRVIHVPAGPAEYVRKEELLDYMGDFTCYMINFVKEQPRPYNLVHANFWMSGLVAADLKAATGIPFVITFHALGQVRRQFQGEQDGFPVQRLEIEQRIAREADGIIAECPQDRQDLIEFYAANPARITEIPCGFDPLELWPINKRKARKQIGVPANELIVLQLGRMVPRKGVDTAIRGFARMVQEGNVAARMVIVGGGSREPNPTITPEIGRLQQIAREENVLNRVIFAGRRGRQELKFYYSAADVFISTPWYEPFGITPVEAMACGTPVIGANVGGIKHTVVDNETGYLVPARDPQAVADCLLALYRDPEKLKRFSQQALKRVNECFTWQKVGERMAGYYEQLLSEISPVLTEGTCEIGKRTEESSIIAQGFEAAIATLQQSMSVLADPILNASRLLTDCLANGGKVMVCGNGGSAADAQHFAAELMGRFIEEGRRALPVISLTADTAFLTAWANDIGYEQIFVRQVEALGRPGDVLVGISTSGRSANVIEAFNLARQKGIKCLALLGGDGGDLLPLADAALMIPAWSTPRIQEAQILIIHLLCELVEKNIDTVPLDAPIAMPQETAEKTNGKIPAYSRLFSINDDRSQK